MPCSGILSAGNTYLMNSIPPVFFSRILIDMTDRTGKNSFLLPGDKIDILFRLIPKTYCDMLYHSIGDMR